MPISTRTLALLPLDDRPCNRLYPQQLAAIAGWEVVLPPRELLGWFTRGGDCDALAEWVEGLAADRVVIALDMLCYGGLVASRRPSVEPADATRRLEALRELRRRRPQAVLFAFSTITRLGTTVASASDLDVHELLMRYSQLLDRVERLGEDHARPELEEVEARLGTEALADYRAVRRRNHRLNRTAIQLVADGVLDYLVIAQEDAAPVGIHVPEQRALRHQVHEYRVGDRVSIHPGADEVGLVLSARHIGASAQAPPRLAVHYGSESGADAVPLFESQPLRLTIEAQMAAAGARPVSAAEADALLFVHTPIGEQGNVSEAQADETSAALRSQAEGLLDALGAAAAGGQLTGLADLAYCNGAEPELMAAVERRGWMPLPRAFAGWNTSANTIGTVVGQLCVEAVAGQSSYPGAAWASRRFLACRLVEDYHYQTCVRPQAADFARRVGADPFALGAAYEQVNSYVVSALEPLAHRVYSEVVGNPASCPAIARVSLPWRRLFEVEVEFVPESDPKKR